jgi:hypothetical protein
MSLVFPVINVRGEWAKLRNVIYSVSLRQWKYSILSNKDICMYFRVLCIPGNNPNSCKHYSFENIACLNKWSLGWVWGKLSSDVN